MEGKNGENKSDEREREGRRAHAWVDGGRPCVRVRVCACVCVCEREREGYGMRGKERGTQSLGVSVGEEWGREGGS